MARYVTFASWDDTPHLSEALKAEMAKMIQPGERSARIEGVPSRDVVMCDCGLMTAAECAEMPARHCGLWEEGDDG